MTPVAGFAAIVLHALAAIVLAAGVAWPTGAAADTDSCQWALDGECDEPRYGGTGACDNGTDTSDCRPLLSGDNTCRWAFDHECDEPDVGTGACRPGTDTADCRAVHIGGDNSCHWAHDGECDEPRYAGTGACTDGTDTADCGHLASGDNTCRWAFDRECDHPGLGTGACLPGTDTADCQALEAGGNDSCRWALDGECDEPGIGTGVCTDGTDVTDCRQVADRRHRDNSCQTAFNDQCEEPGSGPGTCEARTDTVDCLGRDTPHGIRDHFFGHDDRFVPPAKQPPWRSIGLLVKHGGGSCTAALVSPTVALTAAHCVVDDNGAPSPPDSFLAGYDGDSHSARAQIVSYVINPRYAPQADQEGEDWAFLELDWPIGDRVGFFGIHTLTAQDVSAINAGTWDSLNQGGYSWDSPDRMTANQGCRVLEAHEAFGFLHECDTTHGDSGSPLFIERDGRFMIVGVDSQFVDTEKGEVANLAVDSRAFAEPLRHFLIKIAQ